MAHPHPPHSPSQYMKKKVSGQRKKEELEREVLMLQKLLHQEEKVHEILDGLTTQQNASPLPISTNFLPPKVKELLAELAMVESEIGRLEIQITELQKDLKSEKQRATRSKPWSSEQPAQANNAPYKPPLNWNPISKPTFDTKGLHFISKAIKGDYALNPFRLDAKNEDLRDKKSTHLPFEELKLQERVPRKSGLLVPPSPLREPQHPSPKRRERSPLHMPPQKYVSMPIQLEENIQNWHPNKLSESIIKCLNFIYVRLLRTSRTMELEKSGPISRSLHSSLSSRSFRVENGLNSGLSLHKELRQQDPYSIFENEESIPRDIGPYKNLVIFTSTSMDPKSIASATFIPLITKLRVLMSNLQTVDLKPLNYQQKLAFWINMYNACIMNGFLHYGVPSSPEKLAALLNKAMINIGGNTINAQAIEHFILRKPFSMNNEDNNKEAVVRKLYGLESSDPNVTFALCCGTRSSPAVRIYSGEAVTAELERSKLEYLQASIVVTSSRRVAVPELLVRSLPEFTAATAAADMKAVVEWVCNQLPTSGSLRKSMVECFRGHSKTPPTVETLPYDFEFQYLLPS
ncbi:uncharacterized protein LOC111452055 isoform X1 [Cucurbita moschata]|uniref:Uncharacterized protein LOC111452055 isoform X1 n=1 Tax=Cucurbita moschata TaxID=3662 RepID=A0A6J1G939_CUCMO|nr:uncharacterized protein LOC111452055 isoform X1 [Cucurbita moschata]